MKKTFGLYVHVPFCAGGKCPYCDFYSVPYDPGSAREYIGAVRREARRFSARCKDYTADTVYFGGGTPSLLENGLSGLLQILKENFHIADNAEVTLEANPSQELRGILPALRRAGFNRLSMGLQSAVPEELAALGRRHSVREAETAVQEARRAGFANISLDLMLATPGQTLASLARSVDFAASLGVEHISAYLLKVEKGTRYFAMRDRLRLPDEDSQADFYLCACERLERRGYRQYEISNFAKPGFESRHNLRYWNCDEYLGLGPAAHSFLAGRRFFYGRSLTDFLKDGHCQEEGDGGNLAEYEMLRLRLCDGLERDALKRRFGADFPPFPMEKIGPLAGAGLLTLTPERLHLTRKGFLVSNSVIARLLF